MQSPLEIFEPSHNRWNQTDNNDLSLINILNSDDSTNNTIQGDPINSLFAQHDQTANRLFENSPSLVNPKKSSFKEIDQKAVNSLFAQNQANDQTLENRPDTKQSIDQTLATVPFHKILKGLVLRILRSAKRRLKNFWSKTSLLELFGVLLVFIAIGFSFKNMLLTNEGKNYHSEHSEDSRFDFEGQEGIFNISGFGQTISLRDDFNLPPNMARVLLSKTPMELHTVLIFKIPKSHHSSKVGLGLCLKSVAVRNRFILNFRFDKDYQEFSEENHGSFLFFIGGKRLQHPSANFSSFVSSDSPLFSYNYFIFLSIVQQNPLVLKIENKSIGQSGNYNLGQVELEDLFPCIALQKYMKIEFIYQS